MVDRSIPRNDCLIKLRDYTPAGTTHGISLIHHGYHCNHRHFCHGHQKGFGNPTKAPSKYKQVILTSNTPQKLNMVHLRIFPSGKLSHHLPSSIHPSSPGKPFVNLQGVILRGLVPGPNVQNPYDIPLFWLVHHGILGSTIPYIIYCKQHANNLRFILGSIIPTCIPSIIPKSRLQAESPPNWTSRRLRREAPAPDFALSDPGTSLSINFSRPLASEHQQHGPRAESFEVRT